MKLVRMKPGHGDLLLAEGDPALDEERERLIAEFRRQLELGMWAAVPLRAGARKGDAEEPDAGAGNRGAGSTGKREALMVRDFSEVPAGAERVVFFPPAAGG